MRFPTTEEREKRARLAELLEGGVVTVTLDARQEGVDVPQSLSNQFALKLNLSHRFGLSVFELGPLAIRANLSFGGNRHLCILPWTSIYVMTTQGGDRMIFVEDAPAEVQAALRTAAMLGAAMQETSVAPEDAPEPGPQPEPQPSGPFLRLIK